jgi:hypothetical protein
MAVDTYGNPNAVATGELIESAWGNAVEQRVVSTFPSVAVLLAAPLPLGATAIATDVGTMFRRLAGGWSRLTADVGTLPGPGGSYPVGTVLLSTTIAADPGPRVLSFTYHSLATNPSASAAMDIAVRYDGTGLAVTRVNPSQTDTISINGQIGIAAGVAHTLTVVAQAGSVTLVADPTFHFMSWTMTPR